MVQGGRRRFPICIFGCLIVHTECEFDGDDDHRTDLKSMKVERCVTRSTEIEVFLKRERRLSSDHLNAK